MGVRKKLRNGVNKLKFTGLVAATIVVVMHRKPSEMLNMLSWALDRIWNPARKKPEGHRSR